MPPESDIFVLGSGESVSELSDAEIDHINRATCRLAMNKFMAFYKLARILPTHVFYVDYYNEGCGDFLQHIFDVCIQDKRADLVFVLNKLVESQIVLSRTARLLRSLRAVVRRQSGERLYLAPRNCSYEFITHTDWLTGGQWATSLSEPLFHYRASLTSVLNYLSIRFPATTIKLVGVDLNSPRYFFHHQLRELPFYQEDWTGPITAEKGVHFTALEYQGTNMFDQFNYILESLRTTGNKLVNCNPRSLFVEKAILPYAPVISQPPCS